MINTTAASPEMQCDLCGESDFDLVSNRDRHGQPLNTGICQKCGLVSHMPVPSEETVAEYYAKRYRQDYHGEVSPSPRRVMRAWQNGGRILKQLSPFLSETDKVLEVGAGIGCTVKQFELAGLVASGIEPNEDFNRFTREKLHADVANKNLFDSKADERYGLVLLIHVIEHFNSPSRALEHVHSMLRPDGRLYVECPNIAAPFATFGRLFHFAHIYNFTPDTLTLMAEKCGFTVEKIFSDEEDPNLQILFRRAKPQALNIPAGMAEKTRAAMCKYNLLTYHLRPRYLSARIAKLWGYLKEAIFAPVFVRKLLEHS